LGCKQVYFVSVSHQSGSACSETGAGAAAFAGADAVSLRAAVHVQGRLSCLPTIMLRLISAIGKITISIIPKRKSEGKG
jgi:hypothetical protein